MLLALLLATGTIGSGAAVPGAIDDAVSASFLATVDGIQVHQGQIAGIVSWSSIGTIAGDSYGYGALPGNYSVSSLDLLVGSQVQQGVIPDAVSWSVGDGIAGQQIHEGAIDDSTSASFLQPMSGVQVSAFDVIAQLQADLAALQAELEDEKLKPVGGMGGGPDAEVADVVLRRARYNTQKRASDDEEKRFNEAVAARIAEIQAKAPVPQESEARVAAAPSILRTASVSPMARAIQEKPAPSPAPAVAEPESDDSEIMSVLAALLAAA